METRRLGVMERVIFGLTLLTEVATLAFCLVARPTPASVLAPVLGPWAGHLYGHASCTLATVQPAAAWGLLTSLLLAGAGLVVTRGSRLRALASSFLGLTLLFWCAATVLSLVNSLE